MREPGLWFLGLISAAMVSVAYAAETVRLTNGEWPPYFSKSLKYQGVASRIVKAAFASEGIQVEWGFYPWQRSIYLAETGEYDGSVGWSKNPEREAKFHYADVIINQNVVFFHLKSKPFKWETVKDLVGLSIGGTIKYSYGPEFTQADESKLITVTKVTKDEAGIEMVAKGRLDIFPIDQEVGLAMVKRLLPPKQAEHMTFNQKPIYSDPLHLIVSKKNPRSLQIVEAFNRGMKKLRDSGAIEKYFEESRQAN